MTQEHLSAIVAAAEAKKNKEGWWTLPEGQHLTLYVSSTGVSLNIGRVESLRAEGALLSAKTVRGELYIVAMEDVFAGQVEAASQGTRRAGFG